MSNNHILTQDIGNLRGFSTSSSYTRPANVADVAINIDRQPDGTLGPRRGYQCKSADIGGMGVSTYDNPINNTIETITVNDDGNLYKLQKKQIYLYYDGQVDGSITNVDLGFDPIRITSAGHGLTTGTIVIVRNIPGTVEINNNVYTITVIDPNTFSLDGQSPAGLSPFGTGTGEWAIEFTDNRNIVLNIFTDPRYLITNPGWSVAAWSTTPWGAPEGESITAQLTARRAARINGAQVGVNTINVELGHELSVGDTVKFVTTDNLEQTRSVTATTTTSITVDGAVVSVADDVYMNQFLDIPFRRGFDVTTPYPISSFINTLTDPTNGIFGLQVVANGDIDKPAAFIEILEPTVINDASVYTLNYCYWEAVNKTVTTTLPGSANIEYQNSEEFENASFATFDDVLYVANGWDYPQKYDGQTAYRVGMPAGSRPIVADSGGGTLSSATYTYGVTYEQVDAIGHVVEGPLSETTQFQVTNGQATNVTIDSLTNTSGWNTNGALSDGTGINVYGPDSNNYRYHLIGVQNSPHTMKIGDQAFYLDRAIAQSNGAGTGNTMTVDAGHGVEVGDFISFANSAGRILQRNVTVSSNTLITFDGPSAAWNNNQVVSANKTNLVFGNIAIVNGGQNNVNTITVLANHTIQVGDVVTFVDSSGRTQRRSVTAIAATTITIDGPAVSVTTALLIESSTIRTDRFYVRRPLTNTTIASLNNNDPISNNLKINIYRTVQDGDLFALVTTIPNNSITGTTQTFTDSIEAGRKSGDITNVTTGGATCTVTSVAHGLVTGMQITIREVQGTVEVNDRNYTITVVTADTFTLDGVNPTAYTAYTSGGDWEVIFGDNDERGRNYSDPDRLPQAPPISKYLLTFGNQLLYAGGERNTAVNSDNVFFSEGNQPESVPAATNFFAVSGDSDDVTGIGRAGSSLIVFKENSAHSVVGQLLTSQFEVTPLSPGSNIGCIAHATIQSVGSLLYFLHSNGVYAITENQFFPTDAFGNPVPLSSPVDEIFRSQEFLPQKKLKLKRAVAKNYTIDNEYLLFLPAENSQRTQRTANENSILLCYDYESKDWFKWTNMNAAGGMFVIDNDLYFQERRFSGVVGNTANLYKQHRHYRLIDYADHTSAMLVQWRSSWQDLGKPMVRKKFSRCVLFINRESSLLQFNNPQMLFTTYLDRKPDQVHTLSDITTINNTAGSQWNLTPWGFNKWSGYQDSFSRINLKRGSVAKSISVGFTLTGINMSFKLAGFQLEAIPEFRRTIVR